MPSDSKPLLRRGERLFSPPCTRNSQPSDDAAGLADRDDGCGLPSWSSNRSARPTKEFFLPLLYLFLFLSLSLSLI
jgi:hypothetical protein